MTWSLIHAGWMHYILAIINAHDWTMRYVTTFSTEIFSLLNSVIYFHKAIQELQRVHERLSFAAFLYAIIGASGTFLLAIFLSTANSWNPLFHPYIRLGFTEYAAAISIMLFIGMPHIGELSTLDHLSLNFSTSFRPTQPSRSVFFIPFWQLSTKWIFAAIIPGLIITILFFFDHEVSSIICTIDRYGTKRPAGFAWDIALLGTTTAICGILGIPPSNGLLPQAPLHSESLMHNEKDETELDEDSNVRTETRESQSVYEQRWSAFLHAVAILCFISPPLQKVLGLTPTNVLAGLFLLMGEQSLSVKYEIQIFSKGISLMSTSSPILFRFLYLLTPIDQLPKLPLKVKSYLSVHCYTLIQVALTAVIFVVTLTKAAPVFPGDICFSICFTLRLH